MLIIFAWIIWFWLLITVFTDLFRRHDTSGFTKVLWIIFVIVVPFLGVFIYLIVNNHGMSERSMAQGNHIVYWKSFCKGFQDDFA
jgi:ABC-type Fe3+ transport system permease subunit